MAKKKSNKNNRTSSKKVKSQAKLDENTKQVLAQGFDAHKTGNLAVATQAYLSVLASYPHHAETHYLLGIMLFQKKDYAAAEKHLRQCCGLQPIELRYQQALGDMLFRSGNTKAAEEVMQHALNLAPRSFEQRYNLASVKVKLKKYSEALSLFDQAIKSKTKHAGSWNNRGNALIGLCRITEALESYRNAFDIEPSGDSLSNILFVSNYDDSIHAEQLFREHLKYQELVKTQPAVVPKPSNQKLRLGFISADFKTHSVAYFLKPLFDAIDPSEVELYCYYNADVIDDMTLFFKSKASHWCDCSFLNDAHLLGQMRADKLDVLIDLAGHTGSNRAPVLAQRVAPVQVNWLGYPHSTGIEAMDYRLVDEITDPSPSADALASETLLRLPKGFLCYEGDDSISYQAETPYARKGYLTFGSFNNLLKVNEDVVETWCEILKQSPSSRMIVKAKQLGEPSVKQRYEALFTQNGIDLARVDLVAYVDSTAGHLSLYNEVDLALDTFPYNGTTTTCEALWMGVPTITFLGDVHASRVSASILNHAGLPEFIAEDKSSYIEKAVAHALAPEVLTKLRPILREQVKNSQLCDAKGFADQMLESLRQLA
jgi:predicted O-linked N-acetylglucosamine transferase (SPINDLY family)